MMTRTPLIMHPPKALLLAAVGAALLLWGVLLACTATPAQAVPQAVIHVNSLSDTGADDGQCTLREAITSANTDTASGPPTVSARLATAPAPPS